MSNLKMKSGHLRVLIPLLLSLALSACGSSVDLAGSSSGGDIALGQSAPTVVVGADRAGRVYRQEITSPVTGDSVVFQVMEPTELKIGQTYPLVLQGHGYGGKRDETPSDFQQRLIDAGYYVISIDQRGFGQSSGKVRVMDPEYEGQDLIAILDWAENLEGLRRRSNGEMMVGSYSGSYGGMYQFLLAGVDPKHRLRVLAPDITPHDLTYALNPNNVVKSGYGLVLAAGGEANVRAEGLRTDNVILESLIDAGTTGQFPESGLNFFRYHSVRYFCDGVAPGPQSFLLGIPDQLNVPPTPYAQMDVLLTQGMRDSLFNFNDAYNNYQCAKRTGGDVRLLTHESGHILPISTTAVPTLEDALDPFAVALTLPNFQDAGGERNCGTLVLDDVQFAWFEEKLQGKKGALDAALPSGRDICMSLGTDDAIEQTTVKIGGTAFDIDGSTPQLNSVLGVAGALLGNGAREALLATQALYTAPAGGAIIAGLPTMNLTLSGLTGLETPDCATPLQMPACDPILFLGIGHRKAGTERWDLIDDQLTPIRGFGAHVDNMSGIAERLAEGDQLALLIYGFHAQYPISWSRDLLVPALNFSGSIDLPLLQPGDIVREGI